MSQENVDFLRDILDAWNQGDYQAATARVARDVTAECALGGDFDGRYEGLPAVQRWLARFWGSFVDSRAEIGEVFEVDDEVVFEAHLVGRGKASGAEVEMLNWQVITVRDGRLVRYRLFPTKAEALEAVGLREQAMSRENVEVVRAAYDAAQRQDGRAVRDLIAESIVWDMSGLGMPDLAKVYRGHEGIVEFWSGWLAAWETIEFRKLEVEEHGDHVIVEVEQRNRGRASGVDVDFHYWQTFTVRDGRITASRMDRSRLEALEAVGLSE